MSFDVSSLTNTMIAGVREAVGRRWPAIRAIAEPELRKLAQTIEDVSRMYAAGEIDEHRAFQWVGMQRNAALSAVLMVEGLGVLTARAAIDAAAGAAGTVVNGILGFKLISGSPEKPAAPRPVKAQFKAGKDI